MGRVNQESLPISLLWVAGVMLGCMRYLRVCKGFTSGETFTMLPCLKIHEGEAIALECMRECEFQNGRHRFPSGDMC